MITRGGRTQTRVRQQRSMGTASPWPSKVWASSCWTSVLLATSNWRPPLEASARDQAASSNRHGPIREKHMQILHEVSASKRRTWVDPGRTRACNLWFRRPTPYPLGHRTLELFNQLEIQRYSRTKSSNTGVGNRCWRSGSAKPERSRHSSAPQSQNDLVILRHREHCAISCSSSSSSLSFSS